MKISRLKYLEANHHYVPIKFLIITLLCISPDIFVAKSQTSTYSNEFLNIGVDAGSLSQGNSVVSSVDGIYAGYYNPSGLVGQKTPMEISAMHTNYFSGMAQYDYIGFGYKGNDSLSIGLSLVRFGVDDIPNTLNLVDPNGNVNYDRISYFSVADYALFLTLAKISKIRNLAWGASVKIIYRKQGEFASAYGFGFDLGVKYFNKSWKFGAILRDATSTFNIWIFNEELFKEAFITTNNEMPSNSLELTLPKLIIGTAKEFKFSDKILLLTEIDLDMHFDGEHHSLIKAKPLSIDPHLGIQLSYLQNVFIRAGIDKFQLIDDFDKNNKLIFQPSLGIGFSFYNFSLDYALTDVGDLTIAPVSHIFSLKYDFGKIHK
jgi:hypothetical protein